MDPEAILICLATYNERANLPALVARILEALPSAHLLVIDDSSPDGTADWCAQRAASEARLRLLRRPGKLGLGSAHQEAFAWAIRHGYDWLVTMDADGSHDPRHLPALLARAQAEPRCDVVIGSRYCPGGAIQRWPWRRRAVSRCVNRFAQWCLRLPVTDCSSAYRCYRVDRLRQLPGDILRASGFAFFEESLWQLRRLGCTLAEIPIVFVDRRQGTSKADWITAARAASDLVRLAVRQQLTRGHASRPPLGDGSSPTAGD